jgi:hypothetical protein
MRKLRKPAALTPRRWQFTAKPFYELPKMSRTLCLGSLKLKLM